MTGIYTINQIDRRIISLLMEPIKKEFLLSDGQLGLLSGLAFGVTYAAAVIPMGMLSDRTNRRNLLAGAVIVWSGLTALGGFARTYLDLVITRMFVGGSESGASPPAISMISDLFPRAMRTTAISIFESASAIGAIICFLAGGYVAANYGWRAAFLLAGVPGLVLGLVVILTLREPIRGAMEDNFNSATTSKGPVGARSFRDAVRVILGRRSMIVNIIGTAVVSAANVGVLGWLAPFLMRYHKIDIGTAGLTVAFVSGICGWLGIVGSGVLTDRIARGDISRTLYIIAGCTIVSFFTAAVGILSSKFCVAVVALSIFGISCYNYLSISYAVLQNQTPAHLRGTMMAITAVVANLFGYACGPYVVGLLSDAYGGRNSLRTAMLTAVALYLFGVALFIWGARIAHREEFESRKI